MHQDVLLFQKIHEHIRQAKRILLVADGKPDGDSLGSTSAMLNWLLRERLDVRAFCAQKVPQAFSYLDGIHRFTSDPLIFNEAFDLIMTFDAGDLRHCGIESLLPHLPSAYTLINFDHHATNARYGHVNAVFPTACATTEVVFQFFQASNLQLDSAIATSLLTGILTDTSSFSNAATTFKGIETAGHLLTAGARHSDILRHVMRSKSVPILRLWGLGLARLRYNAAYDLASTYFLQSDLMQTGVTDEAIEGVTNFLGGACGGAEAILVLRELSDGRLKGSLRSVRRDISRLAKFLGGGGHKKAAGFTVDARLAV